MAFKRFHRLGFRKIVAALAAAATAIAPIAAEAQSISLLRDAEMEAWLEDYSRPIFKAAGLNPGSIQILLVNDQSFNAFAGGIFLNLRGINPKPDMQQDEMISFRIWIEKNRLITLRRVRIEAINDMVLEMRAGHTPSSIEELVSRMASYLARDIGESLITLNEELDQVEELAIGETDEDLRSRLAEARRQSIVLRRYLAPQRDALQRWLETLQERNLPDVREYARETHDAVLRYVEDLDAFRDRAGIIQDELLTRLSDKLNRNMFVLAMLSVFFLPLTFVTGLLGVNVAGIPLADASWAFGALCLGLAVMAVLQLAAFKYLKWFR